MTRIGASPAVDPTRTCPTLASTPTSAQARRKGLTRQEWLRANAARHGFVEAVPREPWHWEFRGQ